MEDEDLGQECMGVISLPMTTPHPMSMENAHQPGFQVWSSHVGLLA